MATRRGKSLHKTSAWHLSKTKTEKVESQGLITKLSHSLALQQVDDDLDDAASPRQTSAWHHTSGDPAFLPKAEELLKKAKRLPEPIVIDPLLIKKK